MRKWTFGPLAMVLALAPAAVTAAPPASPPALSAVAGPGAHPVQYRRHNGFGAGLGLGLGIGVLGAIIAHEAYGPRPGYDVDDYADAGPLGAAADPAGAQPVRSALPLLRVEYRPLYDPFRREATLPLPALAGPCDGGIVAGAIRAAWPFAWPEFA